MSPILPLVALLLSAPAAASATQVPPASAVSPAPAAGDSVARFSINTRYLFNTMPKTLTDLKVWFPVPFEDGQQKVVNRLIASPYNIETAALTDTGTIIGYMVGGPRGGLPMQIRVSFDLERRADTRGAAKPATAPFSPEMFRAVSQRWLKEETLSAVDQKVKEAAKKITSGRKTPVEKARAIYEHVTTKMTLLTHPRELQGSGYGRVSFTVKEMKGDRTDISSAFVGLCRAAGVPARNVVGLRFPPGEASGIVRDWHLWAEFLTEDQGWIPADPVAGMQEPARRAFYFGSLDPDRLAISMGRDVVLIPPQSGPPLNFFINPYWEGNGKEMPAPYVEAEFTRIDEIKPGFGGSPPLPPTPQPPGGGR